MNSETTRLRFKAMRAAREAAVAELVARRERLITEIASTFSSNAEEWRGRHASCLALARLRARGWRVDPDGRWIDPLTLHRLSFQAATTELLKIAGREPVPPGAPSATPRRRPQ